jgi:hypothetical protein
MARRESCYLPSPPVALFGLGEPGKLTIRQRVSPKVVSVHSRRLAPGPSAWDLDWSGPGCMPPGRVGQHERGGGRQCAAEQAGGAGRLESQGPLVLAARADLGAFHLAPRLPARPRTAPRSARWPAGTG